MELNLILNQIKLQFFGKPLETKGLQIRNNVLKITPKKTIKQKPNVMFTQKLNNPNVDMDSSLMEPTYHSGQINLWKI